MATFAERFKQLRQELGQTQKELLKTFNPMFFRAYTETAISYYENGKRTPELGSLKDFAKYFGVSVSYLLGDSDIRNPGIYTGQTPEMKCEGSVFRVDAESVVTGIDGGIYLEESTQGNQQDTAMNTAQMALVSEVKDLSEAEISEITEIVKHVKRMKEKRDV